MCGAQDSGVIGEEGGDRVGTGDLHDGVGRGIAFTTPSDVLHRLSATGRLGSSARFQGGAIFSACRKSF
jgi:hypothetical protein